ncbi:MAG: hypothetical protein ABIR68_10485 [Ilumatobacteraceae bacterium]
MTLALPVVLVLPAGNGDGLVHGQAKCSKYGGSLDCDTERPGSSAASVQLCPSWERYIPDGPTDAQSELSMQTRDGVEWDLFSRVCGAEKTPQYRWIPQLTPKDLADAAYDSVSKEVPKPELQMSRALDDLIVNVATTVEVTPIDPVTATAQIPGLSATVTATAVRIEVITGSQVSTDVQRISCEPWGGDECTWTPIYPSVFRVTGTNDHRHHGSVSIVWEVAWTSTDGGGGDLGELTTTTPVEFAVREIQIIGG